MWNWGKVNLWRRELTQEYIININSIGKSDDLKEWEFGKCFVRDLCEWESMWNNRLDCFQLS